MPVRETTQREAPARRYTVAISKGGAMVDQMRRLVSHWRPGEPLDEFARRTQEEDVLGNATAYRTRDLVRRVFAPRFLRPDDRPARVLKGVCCGALPCRAFTEMLFVYSARNDPMLRDFASDVFWPAAKRGRLSLDSETVVQFLSEAMADGRIVKPWSENVTVRAGRSLLGFLRDVGLLRETRRGEREIVAYRMSDAGVALLARDLHEGGLTDSAVCEHDDWALFGMSRNDVVSRMNDLGEPCGLIAQAAGALVRITWTVESIGELIDVLSRRHV